MSISSITSSLINLYSYSSLSQSSSTTLSSLTSTDSSTISEQAQSLLEGSTSEKTNDSSDDSSSSGVSTYYQMGSFGQVIEKYANKTLAALNSDDESSEEVEETDDSSEEKGTAYSWNFAISTAGQHSITSGLISLFKSSSGEEREALKEQILTGFSTEGSAYLNYLSSQSSVASDSWTQLSNLKNGMSDRDRDPSLIQVNLDNLDDVDLTSAQREQLNNLQLQVAVVNSYTQLSNSISSINLLG